MNRYKLSKAGINATAGIKRFCGNAEMYEKYLMEFPDDHNYGALCAAIAASDVHASFDAAHALKGLSGTLSMEKLYGDVSILVEELRKDSLVHAEALLQPVKEDYATVLAALQENAG